MKHRKRAILSAAAGFALAMPFAQFSHADDAPPALTKTIRDTQASQQQIGDEAQTVISQIDSILAEYKQHGMENRDDVKTLRGIRKVLDTLSTDEMKQVIDLLHQALNAPSEDAALHQSAFASAAQGNIVQQLKQLLLLHARQERQYDMAERLQQLAKRQDNNLSDLLDANHEKMTGQRPDALQDTLNIQRQQQDQLATDVQSALDDLNAAIGSNAADSDDRIQKAADVARDDKLAENVASASVQLVANHIFQAATAEKASRDSLREMARLLVLPTDTPSRLQQAIKDIDQAIADQQRLNDQTHQLAAQQPDPAQISALEKNQAANVDQTDQIRKNLEGVSPKGVDDLNQAIDTMQEVRTRLNRRIGTDVAQKQTTALAQLQQARQDLVDQSANLEAQQNAGTSNLDKARDLKAQAETLKQNQIALEKETEQGLNSKANRDAQKQQADLRQAALDIQEKALDSAPAAAAPMAEAASDMDSAAQALAKPNTSTDVAVDDQKQAITEIDKTEQAVDQEIARLQQEQKDADQIASAEQEVAKITEAQQKIESQTHQAAARNDDPAVKPLAKDQTALSQDTAAAQASVPPDASAAAASLNNARHAMDQSAEALSNADAKDSAAHQANALADLDQTRDLLAKKENQLNNDLGKPESDTAPETDAAQKLDRAMQETAAADQQLRSAQDGQNPQAASQQLADAAQQIGQITANDAGALPAEAGPPLRQAQQDLSKAAAQAAAGHSGEAQTEAQSASQAMDEAKTAMAMKQAGMPESNGAPHQGQADSAPGKTPGQMPGEKTGETNQNTAQVGNGDRKGIGNGTNDGGPRDVVSPGDQFVGLPPRDRQALQQSRAEKYPQEYAPEVEQYLQNLSDDGKKQP